MSLSNLYIIIVVSVAVVIMLTGAILGKFVFKREIFGITIAVAFVLCCIIIFTMDKTVCKNIDREEVIATYELLDSSYLTANVGSNNTAVYVCYKTDDNKIRK